MDFLVRTDTGQYDLEAEFKLIGNDILVAVWGGQQPHIGAVSAAQARPSLLNNGSISATASVICFLGHKEDQIAKSFSEKLAAEFNTNTVVTAGMHWDDISAGGIHQVTRNAEILLKLLMSKIKQYRQNENEIKKDL